MAILEAQFETHIATSLSLVWLLTSNPASARDPGGNYTQTDPTIHKWFEQLRSVGGEACCALSDGNMLSDTDWRSKDSHFQVFLEGEWIDVPDAAVVKVPNLVGRTIVWPYYEDGHLSVRCFMPGSMI